jgi:predicted ATPase
LAYPRNGSTVGGTNCDAIQLFLQGASRVYTDFALSEENLPHVTRICQLLEGVPLGIELASAWVRVLSCERIAAEIQRDLDFLTTSLRDVPERHRSMRVVFDHSYARLSDTERDVFCKLSVFRGGFRQEAAEKVAGASLPILVALVDKSLLRQTSTGRYDAHELLRQYAAEKLHETPDVEERTRNLHRV